MMKIEHEGEVLTIPQWARRAGLAVRTLRSRLELGRTVAEALQPAGAFHKARRSNRKPKPYTPKYAKPPFSDEFNAWCVL